MRSWRPLWVVPSILGWRTVASCQTRILFYTNNLSGTSRASCLLVIWSNLVIFLFCWLLLYFV